MEGSTAHRVQPTFSGRETEHALALEGLPLATFKQRAFAFLLDLAAAVVIWAPLEIAWRILILGETEVHAEWDFHEAGNIIILLVYHGVFNYFANGRTPGKWITGVRIVSLNSRRMERWQSVERALGYGAAVLEFGLGFVQFFWSANRMCAQDRLAETIVVDERATALGRCETTTDVDHKA